MEGSLNKNGSWDLQKKKHEIISTTKWINEYFIPVRLRVACV
jgi:hypothetical protein